MTKKIVLSVSSIFLLLLTSCTASYEGSNALSRRPCANVDGRPASVATRYVERGKVYCVMKSSKNYSAQGIASWYGPGFHHKRTASGTRYNMYQMTAAHKSLPLSTHVLVTNLKNGRHVVVTINDRGPFVGQRLIDVSYGAAKKLGMVGRGVVPVKVQALSV